MFTCPKCATGRRTRKTVILCSECVGLSCTLNASEAAHFHHLLLLVISRFFKAQSEFDKASISAIIYCPKYVTTSVPITSIPSSAFPTSTHSKFGFENWVLLTLARVNYNLNIHIRLDLPPPHYCTEYQLRITTYNKTSTQPQSIPQRICTYLYLISPKPTNSQFA